MIEDRLARLGPEAAALARALAILGPDATAAAGAPAGRPGPHRGRRAGAAPRTTGGGPRLRAPAGRRGGTGRAWLRLTPPTCTRAPRPCSTTRRGSPSTSSTPRRAATRAVVATLRRAAAAARRVGAPESAVRLLERAGSPNDRRRRQRETVAFELARARLEASGDESGLVALAPRATPTRRASSPATTRSAGASRRPPPCSRPRPRRTVRRGSCCSPRPPPSARAVAPAPSPPRTPAELSAHRHHPDRLRRRRPTIPSTPPAGCSALRLHRHFPISYAVGELTFSAAALLINGDALDDAEQAMRDAARGRGGRRTAERVRRRVLAAGADRLSARRSRPLRVGGARRGRDRRRRSATRSPIPGACLPWSSSGSARRGGRRCVPGDDRTEGV